MVLYYVLVVVGIVTLVLFTDLFVRGAGRVAESMHVSGVVVGAVILGCGVGLPEFALAFHGSRGSPLRALFGVDQANNGDIGWGLLAGGVALALLLTYPILFPDRMKRHSPVILAGTVLFAALLRGSLDRVEGLAMIIGFVIGLFFVVRADKHPPMDPFAPPMQDDYEGRGYLEAPVMTPLQLDMMRALIGLGGTIIGAQLLARSAEAVLAERGYDQAVQGLVLVAFGSVLPHVVVALQALRQHHEELAVGNLIGANLFHSLAIGGLVSVIKPYQVGGAFGIPTLAVLGSTAVITALLLRSEDEMTRTQGAALVGGYLVLTVVTVM